MGLVFTCGSAHLDLIVSPQYSGAVPPLRWQRCHHYLFRARCHHCARVLFAPQTTNALFRSRIGCRRPGDSRTALPKHAVRPRRGTQSPADFAAAIPGGNTPRKPTGTLLAAALHPAVRLELTPACPPRPRLPPSLARRDLLDPRLHGHTGAHAHAPTFVPPPSLRGLVTDQRVGLRNRRQALMR